MGIPFKKQQPSAYAPSKEGDNLTLLGGGALPRADLTDDLNRSPSTTVELHFRPVEGYDWASHGVIVVTDNITGKKWMSEGAANGMKSRGTFPASPLYATTKEQVTQWRPEGRQTASFVTDVPANEVAKRLKAFSDAFSERRLPYDLPIPPINPNPDVWVAPPQLPVRNSNYYASAAWEHLTGSVPRLPSDLTAPGWGDHRLKPGRVFQ
jgi:hypothetical protein